MMDITPEVVAERLALVQKKHPLVHNITNFVVMNFSANALLALGAAPVMAHAPEEVEEMAGISDALVLNIGTPSVPWLDSMCLAARAAREKAIPVVLDPVGAGATQFRSNAARRLLDTGCVSVIRGNTSEIMAVAGLGVTTRGVDTTTALEEARFAANQLALTEGVIVAMTGQMDYVTDGRIGYEIANGHPLMGKVTGTGCVASAFTAAFCGVVIGDYLRGVASAISAFGIAGEMASRIEKRPGSFQIALLDCVSTLNTDDLVESLDIRK